MKYDKNFRVNLDKKRIIKNKKIKLILVIIQLIIFENNKLI